MDPREATRISELLIYCCDGLADKDQIAELESLLDQRPEAIEYGIEVLMDLNYFHCLGQTPLSAPLPADAAEVGFMSDLDPQQQLALLGDFAEYEKNALRMEIQERCEETKPELIRKIRYERPVRTINKYSIATALVAAAALLLMILYVRIAPPAPYEVATLKDSIKAEWSSGLPLAAGTRLSSHSEPIRLTSGIVKFVTDDNVELLLEAPTEFKFVSYNEVALSYGKLFARVSEQGYGFSVATPNSRIVDLGTEFGILSQIDGSTEVYMVEGKANLFAGEKTQTKTSRLLLAGAARKVDRRDASVQEIPMDETAFVRQIHSGSNLVWNGQETLHLTDLLLGGNGFGTAVKESIEYDPATGREVAMGDAGNYRKSPGKPALIAENPYVDCVFVPGRDSQDIVISSAGHRFQNCPPTTGLYYSNIICGKTGVFFDPLQQAFEQSRQLKHFSYLYLHSNIGLTIDLEAVRQAVAGLRVSSFIAYAGIIDLWNNTPDFSEVDIWVLVDGAVKAERKGLRCDQGYPIEVPLRDGDRFLTLVVTDGGKVYSEGFPANHFDTCGFAEPVFGLTAK